MDNIPEHLIKPDPILLEIHRVLAPSGTLIVGVPGVYGYTTDPDHKHFYDEKTLRTLLGKVGFKSRKVFHMPLRSTFLERKMSQYCIYGVFQRDTSQS